MAVKVLQKTVTAEVAEIIVIETKKIERLTTKVNVTRTAPKAVVRAPKAVVMETAKPEIIANKTETIPNTTAPISIETTISPNLTVLTETTTPIETNATANVSTKEILLAHRQEPSSYRQTLNILILITACLILLVCVTLVWFKYFYKTK